MALIYRSIQHTSRYIGGDIPGSYKYIANALSATKIKDIPFYYMMCCAYLFQWEMLGGIHNVYRDTNKIAGIDPKSYTQRLIAQIPSHKLSLQETS